MRQWTYSGGRTQTFNGSGTYAVGTDCTLSLTFVAATPTTGGATGAASAPTAFKATLNSTTNSVRGLLILEPVNVATVSGRIVAQ